MPPAHPRQAMQPQPQPQVAPGGEGIAAQPGEAGWMPDEPMMPFWLEVAFPWMVSFMLHLGILILLVFMMIMFSRKGHRDGEDNDPIVIPTGAPAEIESDRPAGRPNPGMNDPTREAAQNKFKEITDTDGWAQNQSDTPSAGMFAGSEGALTDVIGLGTGGTVGVGSGGNGTGDGGKLARYGMPGGGSGPGPKGLFGVGGTAANRIVYVLDHSGSMIDTFDFLRAEVKDKLQKLTPAQRFSVIMFSEEVDQVFPKDATALVSASPMVKKDLVNFVDNVRAAGKNDDLYDPFAKAMQKAFAMQPQIIYFLTDGNFDPKVADEVKRLNTAGGGKVRVYTIAFIKVSKEAEESLKTIALDNGGKFKYVQEKDLGR
jgi:hypothetical protein